MSLTDRSNSKVVLSEESAEKAFDQEEKYDPYDDVQLEKSTTYFESLLIILKASLGTGILSMPKAFSNAGYVLGILGTIAAGALTTCTVHFISQTEYELCKRKRIPRMSYPETIAAAFEYGPGNSNRFKRLAEIIGHLDLILLEFGADCVYAIFISVNIKQVADQFFEPMNVRTYLLILLVPFILICWTRNLKNLAPGSTLGTCCGICCYGLIFYYILTAPPTLEKRKAYGSIQEFSLFVGTAFFALGSFGMVLPVKNKMRKPKQYDGIFGVINASMLPCVLLYGILGVFGYLAYGSNTRDSVTLNLKKSGAIGNIICLLLAGCVFMTYPLCHYVVFDLTWNRFIKSKLADNKHLLFWEYVFRTFLTVVNILCASAIPHLSLFIDLVGSLCFPALGVFFPTIIYTLTFWNSYKGLKFFLFILRSTVIMLIGSFAFTVGVYTSISEIVKNIMKP